MKNQTIAPPFGKGQFNTLAQSGTTIPSISKSKRKIIVRGNGSEATNKETLRNRTKKKMIAQKVSLGILDAARQKGEVTPQLKKTIWNTWHCQGQIIHSGEKLYGTYCKNRICPICCGNRRAELIRKYYPMFKKWLDEGNQLFFVTLTVKSVPASRLKLMVERGVLRAFRMITGRYRKKHQRGKGKLLSGIKALECNFNPKKRTYNVHLHLIVMSHEIAEIFIKQWMEIWSRKRDKISTIFVDRRAQNFRQVGNLEEDLIEIIKYGTKIFMPEDVTKKRVKNTPHKVYARALYNIHRALKGHRIFDRFGFDLKGFNNKIETKSTILVQYDELEFEPKQNDWVNSETRHRLTDFIPDSKLTALLNNIDTVLE